MSAAASISPSLASFAGVDLVSGPLLRIVDGVHRGVEVRLDADSCTVGSSRDADIVLSDAGIAAEHLRLRFYGRTMAVDALGGEVRLKGRPPLAVGQGCRMSLPAELDLGVARVTVSPGALPAPFFKRLSLVCVGLLAVLLVPAVTLNVMTRAVFAEASPSSAPAPDFADAMLRTGSIASDRPGSDISSSLLRPASLRVDPLTALRGKASDSGLSGLSFRQDGNHIEVSGAVPGERVADWTAIRQWFDGSFGDRFVLTGGAAVAAVPARPKFTFQAVWFGPRPYVINSKGERLYPGGALGDGWLLKSIEKGRILVGRGAEEFALTL